MQRVKSRTAGEAVLYRLPTAKRTATVFQPGEFCYDTTTNMLYSGNGSTAGGVGCGIGNFNLSSTGESVAWNLKDNVASALSFDADGQAGVLAINTDNATPGISTAGIVAATGAVYTEVGVDTAGANPLTIGATNATGVTIGKAALPTACPGGVQSTLFAGAAATGCTATEYGDGQHHLTRIAFTDLTFSAISGAGNLALGKKLYDLPTSDTCVINYTKLNVSLTNTDGNIDADTPDCGVGTVVASGANALLSATATFEDVVTGQTIGDCTGTPTFKTVVPTASVALIKEDGATNRTLFLNVAANWSGAESALKATGEVIVSWTHMY